MCFGVFFTKRMKVGWMEIETDKKAVWNRYTYLRYTALSFCSGLSKADILELKFLYKIRRNRGQVRVISERS